jgi:polygalacturonase
MKIFGLASILAAILAAVSTGEQATHQETEAGCTLTGNYVSGADVSTCAAVVVDSLKIPAGVTLDLTKVKDGATITFQGTSTFGTKLWDGPLVLLTGNNLKITGSGTLDGQGKWYWDQGQTVTRPVFFRLNKVTGSTLSSFTLKNSPFRTFSILSSTSTTLTGLTLDSSAGNGLAKNTDGFDLSRNDHVTITGCHIFNQDDCLAMQSSTNTIFSGNTCSGGHGISIGSIGGDSVDASDTVNGLTVVNNKIIDSDNGIRIKTIEGLQGLVTNANYTSNTLSNVKHAIVVHSDYSKAKGGYTGNPTSKVAITHITINGLSGTATDIYDIKANPSVVSNWDFKSVTVSGAKGSCSGQPTNVVC